MNVLFSIKDKLTAEHTCYSLVQKGLLHLKMSCKMGLLDDTPRLNHQSIEIA
jgi:hypothetical protein